MPNSLFATQTIYFYPPNDFITSLQQLMSKLLLEVVIIVLRNNFYIVLNQLFLVWQSYQKLIIISAQLISYGDYGCVIKENKDVQLVLPVMVYG